MALYDAFISPALEEPGQSDRLIRCRTAVGAAACAWEQYWIRKN